MEFPDRKDEMKVIWGEEEHQVLFFRMANPNFKLQAFKPGCIHWTV